MNAHRLLNVVAGCLLAMAIGTALSTSHLIDSDLSDETATADAVADAQADAKEAYLAQQREAMMERAADQQCIRMHGADFRHRWTSGGDMICVRPNGRTAVIATAGAL